MEPVPVHLAPEIDPEILRLFFPGEQTLSINIYLYVSYLRKYAQIHAIMNESTVEFTEMGLVEYTVTSTWTIPTAAQMDDYRQLASQFDRESGSLLVNNVLLRDLVISHHLKDLYLPQGETQLDLIPKLKSPLDRDDLLKIKKIHSGIYDILYSKFISDSCLVV